MIIVEGPDGSGKSTLIAKLGHTPRKFKALRAGVGGVNSAGTGDGIFGWAGNLDAVNAYAIAIEGHRDTLIACDRFHLSERVYCPMLRGYQSLDEHDFERINAIIRRARIPVILCLPPFEQTLINATVTGRERPSYQTEAFLREAYTSFVRLAPYATLVYDYTVDPLPTL